MVTDTETPPAAGAAGALPGAKGVPGAPGAPGAKGVPGGPGGIVELPGVTVVTTGTTGFDPGAIGATLGAVPLMGAVPLIGAVPLMGDVPLMGAVPLMGVPLGAVVSFEGAMLPILFDIRPILGVITPVELKTNLIYKRFSFLGLNFTIKNDQV